MSQLQADPHGPNPLVDDLEARNPVVFKLASSEAPAPTLFASGDLPPFTASGVDPQVLARLPFTMRHFAASEPDPAAVLGLIEQYADQPDYTLNHQGLDDYRQRVDRWARGLDKPPTELGPEEQDQILTDLFGPGQ